MNFWYYLNKTHTIKDMNLSIEHTIEGNKSGLKEIIKRNMAVK